jgi:hypothetical protein
MLAVVADAALSNSAPNEWNGETEPARFQNSEEWMTTKNDAFAGVHSSTDFGTAGLSGQK